MFTGLIEKVGCLERLSRQGNSQVLTISHSAWEPSLKVGESVAVQGACLTVAQVEAARFTCDVLQETLARTALSGKAAGAALNLERAMTFGGRVGGHLVQGHVDGTGRVLSIGDRGGDLALRIECETTLCSQMLLKGSVALDGVSLTISALDRNAFEVRIIPVTWRDTSLSRLSIGEAVNVETDMIGKYVRRYLQEQPANDGLAWDDLARAGII